MNLLEQYGIDITYVLAGMTAFLLLLLIMVVALNVKYSKLNKKYQSFMIGTSGDNIEKIVLERFEEIRALNQVTEEMNQHLKRVDETLMITYQKSAIVKYDAFKEMGGKLSFVLALLNESNDGFLINSMHSSREGCYTYVKEIIKGESFVPLSEEERQALEEAKNSRKYLA